MDAVVYVAVKLDGFVPRAVVVFEVDVDGRGRVGRVDAREDLGGGDLWIRSENKSTLRVN